MIITYDDIYKGGDTNDHEYGRNESEKEKWAERVRYRKGLMIVVMKKERMCRKRRNIHRKTHRLQHHVSQSGGIRTVI